MPLRNNTTSLSRDYTMQELDKITSNVNSIKKPTKKGRKTSRSGSERPSKKTEAVSKINRSLSLKSRKSDSIRPQSAKNVSNSIDRKKQDFQFSPFGTQKSRHNEI
jgi:hypothetical protein